MYIIKFNHVFSWYSRLLTPGAPVCLQTGFQYVLNCIYDQTATLRLTTISQHFTITSAGCPGLLANRVSVCNYNRQAGKTDTTYITHHQVEMIEREVLDVQGTDTVEDGCA